MVNPNDPAFPFAWEGKQNDKGEIVSIVTHKQSGMSIRTQVAAMAMQGFLAYGMANPERVASDSVQYADALIEQLNKDTNVKEDK